ncbi:hypothetical protein ABT330_28715 [Streptomyces sp. NPDC000658]|uniref:hypothetical protein n=1 Tax=Streptomyces sp. NPDC000658 TaxID=3154266 RepID=UPI00332033B7
MEETERGVMTERSGLRTPPAWAMPGNRWTPWVFWPLLCWSITLLVWRISDGASTVRILVAAGLILVFGSLLAANRAARRKQN